MNVRSNLESVAQKMYGRALRELDDSQLYFAILNMTKDMMNGKGVIKGSKKIYYISAEFLIGKLLSNNLINLGIYEELDAVLKEEGKELSRIEEVEPEPSLGNGGLGRLAACFLDSIASLGLPGDGIGLNYHFGLFKQVFKDRQQTAEKNDWIEDQSWLTKTDISFPVYFGKKKVMSRLYDIDVIGYEQGMNKLHLFDIETIDEGIVKDGINFDKADIDRNLTLFLYPDDSDEAGQQLRIYQQYFMVCNGAQLILKEMKDNGCDLHRMYEHAVIQINDTHPTMVIPELIRILTEDEGFDMEEAIDVVSRTCAYTNHTILAEALEKWPVKYLQKVVPQLMPIIWELDKRASIKYKDPSVQIIDDNMRVHMAHIDIHYGFSVNGVAAIHTQILKDTELNNFYRIYPEKFNNKTNGITFRRWLLSCNRELAACITRTIGAGYKKDAAELEKLMEHLDDTALLKEIRAIKKTKKEELVSYLKENEGQDINPESIFDIQVKRLHEYKRQQMNALYIIHKYLEIKGGRKPSTPITFIFGAKAAPAYIIAQDIIHLLLCLQEIVNNDPDVKDHMKVVMVENYNVSYAEKLIPACDISEQISLASKEASGTGNMKFMLNGALTLGTMDGANVEIVEEVGEENAFIFGLSSDEVINYENNGGYDPMQIFNSDKDIHKVLTQLIDGTYDKDKELFRTLYNSLLNTLSTSRADTYFILKDFKPYAEAQRKVEAAYRDSEGWAKSAILNVACSGKFTSDRTIQQYVDEIWHLDKVTL